MCRPPHSEMTLRDRIAACRWRASRGREARVHGDDHGRVVGLGDRGRGIGLRPRGASHRGAGCRAGSRPARAVDCAGGGADPSLPGERDRHGDGQGGAGGAEAGGDPGLDGDARVPAPSGRGGPRRPRADPGRRRGDRAVAERRDRRGAPADPGITAAGGVPGGDHRAHRQHARPRGRPVRSRWGRSRRRARLAWPPRRARPH